MRSTRRRSILFMRPTLECSCGWTGILVRLCSTPEEEKERERVTIGTGYRTPLLPEY